MRKLTGSKICCLTCGVMKYYPPYRITAGVRFCSNRCRGLSLMGIPSWNKGKHLTPEHKKRLSDAKLKNPVRYWKGKHTTSGDKHYNWQGGITPVNEKIRKSRDYMIWRVAVFIRDDYKCVICKVRGGRLHADHIKPFSLYPELRLSIDNGRTLCYDCHKSTDTWGYNVRHYSAL